MNKLYFLMFFSLPLVFLTLESNFVFGDILVLIIFLINLFSANLVITKFDIRYFFLTLLFISSNLIALMFSNYDISNSVFKLMQMLFIFYILYPVIKKFVNKVENLELILKALILACNFSIMYAIIIGSKQLELVSTIHGRYFSFFGNPWIFSFFIMMCIPYTNYFFLSSKSKVIKLFYLISILLQVYGLLLSGSRTGIICLIIFIFIYIYIYIFKNFNFQIKILSIVLVGILIIYITFNYTFLIEILVRLVTPSFPNLGIKLSTLMQDDIDTTRSSLFSMTSVYLRGSPFIGLGLGNFYNYSGLVSMHSYFLSFWVEGGFFALFSILLLHVYAVKIIFSKRKILGDDLFRMLIISNILFLVFTSLNPVLMHRFYWLVLLISLSIENLDEDTILFN